MKKILLVAAYLFVAWTMVIAVFGSRSAHADELSDSAIQQYYSYFMSRPPSPMLIMRTGKMPTDVYFDYLVNHFPIEIMTPMAAGFAVFVIEQCRHDTNYHYQANGRAFVDRLYYSSLLQKTLNTVAFLQGYQDGVENMQMVLDYCALNPDRPLPDKQLQMLGK